VDVEEVYDAFSYGHKTPQAIKDFLLYARKNWLRSPRYVLLTGDSTFDPRDYLGRRSRDYVPVRLIDAANMENRQR